MAATKAGKVALITGINGQTGSYLAEFLLARGYNVHGMIRPVSNLTDQLSFIAGFSSLDEESTADNKESKKVMLHYGEMQDFASLCRLIAKVQPDEIYNLAAQSQQDVSFSLQAFTTDVTAVGYLRIIEAVRILGLAKKCRIFQPTTSVLLDFKAAAASGRPVNEETPHHPRSVYAVSKLMALWLCRLYRESNPGFFLANGILFNHESPRRQNTFASRKMSSSVARIKKGLQESFEMANFHSSLDWGYAIDFVEAMWAMLQHGRPDDFVVATGEGHTIREFCSEAFSCIGRKIEWRGEGVDEFAIETASNKVRIRRMPKCENTANRLAVNYVGDASKARRELNWAPKLSFSNLVHDMVKNDIELLEKKENTKQEEKLQQDVKKKYRDAEKFCCTHHSAI